ncbi:Smr/MutS family protein [Massilia sp. W12]|uniref:Smr/MutS family protein n=1 Tax=Massilia sp. W12 TaxID=3126507 RepID=UPI0030D57632
MTQGLKQFADLKILAKQIKERAAQEREAQRLRAIAAQRQREEANLFRLAVGAVTPLKDDNRVEPFFITPQPVALQYLADEQAALVESLSDEFDALSLLETDQALSYTRPGVGPEVVRRLRRGHWVIQDELDLHGLRRDDARESLALFLRLAGKRGIRCVRIIHGKGHGSVNKEPVLKNMVFRWLAQKQEVMAFCVARAADGGAGALVVLLQGQTRQHQRHSAHDHV